MQAPPTDGDADSPTNDEFDTVRRCRSAINVRSDAMSPPTLRAQIFGFHIVRPWKRRSGIEGLDGLKMKAGCRSLSGVHPPEFCQFSWVDLASILTTLDDETVGHFLQLFLNMIHQNNICSLISATSVYNYIHHVRPPYTTRLPPLQSTGLAGRRTTNTPNGALPDVENVFENVWSKTFSIKTFF